MTGMETTELELRSDPAEQALIGAVAHHPDALAGTLAQLAGADFYDVSRGLVWDACRALSADRKPVDPVSVSRRLAAAKNWSVSVQRVVTVEMSNAYPAAHAAAQAAVVADLARRRELLRSVNRARAIVGEHPGDTSEALAAVRAVLDGLGDTDQPEGGPLGWDQLIEEFEAAQAPGGSRPGIPSPWPDLDAITGGFFGSRVVVIGGRPAQGKSTAALNAAMHAAAESGKQVLVISQEMPSVDVTGRILAAGAEVELRDINSRRLTAEQLMSIRSYVKRVGRPPITVDARPRGLASIKSLARAHHHRRGLDLMVVDYLQLIRTEQPSRSREQEVAQVSRELKALAMELDVAMILPAQLNRESGKRADPRPTMADLRDSGQIEQDADAVILLYRPTGDDPRAGEIDFILDKHRHGPTATITMRWHGGYGMVSPLGLGVPR